MKKPSIKDIEKDHSNLLSENTVSKNTRQQNNLLTAVILIVLGIILLLNNFNILPWSIWQDLWRLWPLLLIFWGFNLIVGKSKKANTILIVITSLVIIFFLLITAALHNIQLRNYLEQKFHIQIPNYQNKNDVPSEFEQDGENEETEEYFEDWEKEFEFP